jgi:hypothetical protein
MLSQGHLTTEEKALVRRAIEEPWSGALRAALCYAVECRGFRVSPCDHIGRLVDFLELLSQSGPPIRRTG